jgi:hypothetical protein
LIIQSVIGPQLGGGPPWAYGGDGDTFIKDGRASDSVLRTSPWGFGKRKSVDWFIGMGVIVWRDDVHGPIVKGNDGGGWSSDGVVLQLGRRQN